MHSSPALLSGSKSCRLLFLLVYLHLLQFQPIRLDLFNQGGEMDILSPFSVNILLIRSKHPNMKTTCTSASPSGQTVLGRENIVLEGILAAAEREFPQTVHIPVLGCSATNTNIVHLGVLCTIPTQA